MRFSIFASTHVLCFHHCEYFTIQLPVVVERINKVLEGVVDVEVEWTGGDLQGQVGEHFVQCKVTRLKSIISGGYDGETFVDDEGRNVFTQCFHVPFTIVDTNECVVPKIAP